MFILFSCSSSKKMLPTPKSDAAVKTVVPFAERLTNTFNQKDPWKNHMVGFVINDVKTGQQLFGYKADKYFTPASNMKLFTYFTCLKILKDKEPLIAIAENERSIYFRGTGHPAFLHPHLEKDTVVFNYLRESKKQLVYNEQHFKDESYGPGWALDDVSYYYQAEKSALPIYGNTLIIKRLKGDGHFHLSPNYFQKNLKQTDKKYRLPRRDLSNNTIYISNNINPDREINLAIPFKYSSELLIDLLEDTLQQTIIEGVTDKSFLPFGEYPTALLYDKMMQNSDNPIAEQLLLMASYKLFDTINTKKIITHSLENYLTDIKDQPRWVDGSGLSRYNLATPQSINSVLLKIYDEIGLDSIRTQFSLIELETNGPIVFAKTGSLSNNFNLSGYMMTNGGKTIAFSFMNNHFMQRTRDIYGEMKKLLIQIYHEY